MIKEKVNIAPQSTDGHYVEKSENVVNLDKATESFFVEGNAILTTSKHTTLPMEKDCFIAPQKVYNPFSEIFERSKD